GAKTPPVRSLLREFHGKNPGLTVNCWRMENVDKGKAQRQNTRRAPVERSPRDDAVSKRTAAEPVLRHERPQLQPELKRRIDDLIHYFGGGYNEDLIEDL